MYDGRGPSKISTLGSGTVSGPAQSVKIRIRLLFPVYRTGEQEQVRPYDDNYKETVTLTQDIDFHLSLSQIFLLIDL